MLLLLLPARDLAARKAAELLAAVKLTQNKIHRLLRVPAAAVKRRGDGFVVDFGQDGLHRVDLVAE